MPIDVFANTSQNFQALAHPGHGITGHAASRMSHKPVNLAGIDLNLLVALDALSGVPVPTFGKGGIVDLKEGLPRAAQLPKTPPGASSPPVIVGDVVIAGVSFSAGGAPPS